MLSKIFIQNFALIDHLDISLHEGLQVITGETGAGKSIILGALRLVMGERADLKSIANTDQKSIVEVEFKINDCYKSFFEENDLDFDYNTIIRREILPSGKSRAFINDVPVTLDILKSLTKKLIDIHSQFETSNLFSEAYQFGIIDGIAGNQSVLLDYQQQLSDYKNLKQQLSELKSRLAEGIKEKDYKDFLLSELEDAQLENLDFEELKTQLSMQENAEQISEVLAEVNTRLHSETIGVIEGLQFVKTQCYKLTDVSETFQNISERLDSVYEELNDIGFEIGNAAESVEVNPQLLEVLTSKVNQINTLLVKHQATEVEELLEIKHQLSEEQSNFEGLEVEISKLEKTIIDREKSLQTLAQQLSENRKKAIPKFVAQMTQLLKQLGLEKATIDLKLSSADTFNPFGKEHIAILFQANSGFAMQPIQQAISGGERSRVMLAIKKIMAENTDLPTLILDEIDTGVSGRIAEEIGRVMKTMAKDMQLIVITHLAQVAAKGDYNYKVVKQDVDGKTESTIILLSQEDKLNEIAQLLSGSKITNAALEQAKELMQ